MRRAAVAFKTLNVPCIESLSTLLAGKVGAIVAGVVLDQISDQNKFIVSAITGLIGFVITIIFVPGAPLQESCPCVMPMTQQSSAEAELWWT